MSEIEKTVSFPLDNDEFFRRECPLCHREFKVLLEEGELTNLAQKCVDSFMIEQNEDKEDIKQYEYQTGGFICPYCGQQSPAESYWTQEQIAYIGIIIENIVAKLTNENLIRPLQRTFRKSNSGMISIEFRGKEMEQKEEWISPEVNDMEIFDLPCCQRKIKIEENRVDMIYCFFCGFPHKYEDKGAKGV